MVEAKAPKLTKAQRRYLEQAARGETFTRDVLSGPEWLMAERLQARGLLSHEHRLARHDWYYAITDAGRAAIAKAQPHDGEERS